MLPQIGRIHPIQLTPLKADESLVGQNIQATSWFLLMTSGKPCINFLTQIKAKLQKETGEN